MDPLRNIPGVGNAGQPQRAGQSPAAGGPKFAEVLKSKLEGLKWSGHAQQRLQSRGITLSDRDRQLIDGALKKAAEKGSRNSLFLLRDIGLVVSVQNKTVVTAVDKADLKERVFTEIDSTVILD
jgi:flagellar operon protein